MAAAVIALATIHTVKADEPAAKEHGAEQKSKYHGLPVVYVDVRYILCRYRPLTKELDKLKYDLHTAAERRAQEEKEVREMKNRLKELRPDSSSHDQFEKQIIEKEVKSATTWTSEEHRLRRRRAKMFFDAYQEVRADLTEFLKENEITVVLNFDGDLIPGSPLAIPPKIERNQEYYEGGLSTGRSPIRFGNEDSGETADTSPEKVENIINSTTVVVNPEHDITPIILGRLEEKFAKKAAVAANEDKEKHGVKK